MTFKDWQRTPLHHLVEATSDVVVCGIAMAAIVLADGNPAVKDAPLGAVLKISFVYFAIRAGLALAVCIFGALACLLSLMFEPRYAITPEAQ